MFFTSHLSKKNILATPLVLLLDPIFNASYYLLTSVINSQRTCARAAVCVCVYVCVCVCVCVCLSLTDIEDGFVLSPNGHQSTAGDSFKGFKCSAF